MKNKIIAGLFISAITLGGLTFSQTNVDASEWKANTPDQIQITKDQKEYTLKNGDTLWAIGQKININVDTLAKINQIDLAKGEEKNLPIGRVISFDGNKVTVKEQDGSVVNEAVIKKEDKVDPKKPVGEPVDGSQSGDNNKNTPAPSSTIPAGSIEGNGSTDVSALETSADQGTTNDAGTPGDTDNNSNVTPSAPNQPATPAAPTATPAPQPSAPVQPSSVPSKPQTDSYVIDNTPPADTIPINVGNSGMIFNTEVEQEAWGNAQIRDPQSKWYGWGWSGTNLVNSSYENLGTWTIDFYQP